MIKPSGLPMPRVRRFRRPLAILAFVLTLSAAFGATLGYYVRIDTAGLTDLDDYAPPQMTRVLARDGSEVASFGAEKRILLADGDMPESFRQALIASEDSRFEQHSGVDLVGVVRALLADARQRRLAQGASTLTMQLAGNLFLDRSQRTVQRKVQEIFLAMEVERRYSKQEILRHYADQVHFGHGLYGLEAASRYYFGKPARLLSIGESATLVGLLPRPASYSPFRDLKRSTERRNLVLRRMVQEGFLAVDEAKRIADQSIVTASRRVSGNPAPYFIEQVRRELQETYGSDLLYGGGLVVQTTLDPRLQRIARRSVENGLRRIESRQGARANGVQAALVALDPSNGEILALVGGADFSKSEFDRAVQAKRQPGSLFKPFVYAAALERGWTLADTIIDEPTVFVSGHRSVPYQPENFSRRYYGSITLRAALERSINIATVKLLTEVGYEPVIDVARRLGVQSRLRPYPSLALGTFELSLLEVTRAYATIANRGLRVEPHWIDQIDDGAGRTIYRSRVRVSEALSPQVAYVLTQALVGVVGRGTGKSAGAVFDRALAGKTGTTDDNTDAWFVGFSPDLVVGVWVGHDDPRSLGAAETGGRAALPIWIEFMKEALADRPDVGFDIPKGVERIRIDSRTGLRPTGSCGETLSEVFIAGTDPASRCTRSLHDQRLLPYPLHRYSLDANGMLEIPQDEIDALLEREPHLLSDGPDGLEAYSLEKGIRLPIRLLPNRERTVEQALAEKFEAGDRVGTDGRPATIVSLSPGE